MRRRLVCSLVAAVSMFAPSVFAQEAPPPPLAQPTPTPPAPTPPAPMPPTPPTQTAPPPPHWDMPPGMRHEGAPGPRADVRNHRVVTTVDGGGKDVVVQRRVKTEEMYGRQLFVIPEHTETQTWEPVCVAPCTVDLDRSSTYRVAKENGVTGSSKFTLPPGADQVKLTIEPGNGRWHSLSTSLLSLGTAASIVGAALLTTASTWESKSDEKDVRTSGVITGGIGLILLGVGIPIAILTRTHVTANDTKVANTTGPHLSPTGLVF